MKSILILSFFVLASVSFSQNIFKDGKKYGISKNGGNPEVDKEDSLIVRAEYDEIVEAWRGEAGGAMYSGRKGDEWNFITSDKLVNQQRYESIELEAWESQYAFGFRDGYIDVVFYETDKFLIRNVSADMITLELGYIWTDNTLQADILITKKGKDKYGAILADFTNGVATLKGKEILKAEYSNIFKNDSIDNTLIAFKEGTYYFHKLTGELIFKLTTEQNIVKILDHNVEGGYTVKAQGKKSELMGFYYPKEKWFIEPIYQEIKFLANDPAVAVVHDEKAYGLIFQGKMILECEWDSIEKSEEQGTVAIVTNKKGRYYVFDDGKTRAL